jgi:Ca2+-binding RTX toxin-like protein
MEARRHGWLVGAVAVLALGAFAPAAGAATANITDDGTEQVLHFDAAAGENNNLVIEGGPTYKVAELPPVGGGTPVHIAGDANCPASPPPGDPVGSDGVSCQHASGIDRIVVNLGDGTRDDFEIVSADVPVIVNGGAGADFFDDMEQTNLPGQQFARTFNGGDGDDAFRVGIRSGMPSEYHGDAGTDRVLYGYRSLTMTLPPGTQYPPRPQTITLDDVANDGETGELDNVHSDIEYVFGSDAADTISGTANADYLVGNGGADTIDGLGGDDDVFADDATGGENTPPGDTCDDDVLNGGDGADRLTLGGATTANGGADNDTFLTDLVLCPGKSDVANGGTGVDFADFSRLTTPGLSVSLDNLGNDGLGGTDNYSDIEDVEATSGGMAIIGSAAANHLIGGAGNDLIDGGLGADQMGGGGGIDTVDYSSRTAPLTLTIGTGDTDGETGENDGIIDDVENVRGGSGADTIVGNALNNVLDGGLGADNITGGAGVDAVDYSRRTAVVSVTLNAGAGNDGETGENDTIASDVEGAFGGSAGDKLIGAAGNGFLAGLAGNDELSDGGGVDTLDAGAGDDTIDSVDGAADHDICGAGADKVTSDAIDTVDADCDPATPPTGPPASPPTGPTPPSSPPPPPVAPIDHTAPSASLALGTARLGKLLSSGLKVSVRSSEAGTLRAVLTAESTTARALKRSGVRGVLASGKATAAQGATKTLTLKLTRKTRNAMRGMAVAKLKLVVTVTDRVGNRRTLTRHLKLRR